MSEIKNAAIQASESDRIVNVIGRNAKDSVTGFSGRVTGVCFRDRGFVQIEISPSLDSDGKYVQPM